MTLWILLAGLAWAQDDELPDVEPEPVPDAVFDDDEAGQPERPETALPEEGDPPRADEDNVPPGPQRIDPPRSEDEELPRSDFERALRVLEPVPPLVPPDDEGLPRPEGDRLREVEQQPVPDTAPDPAGAAVTEPGVGDRVEITVFGPAAIRQARRAIVREMVQMGYDPIDRGGGRVVFRPPRNWMGRVVLDETGDLTFRRPIIAFRDGSVADRQRENEIRTPPGMEANPNISREPEGYFFFEGASDEGEGFATPPIQGSVHVLPSLDILEPIWEEVTRRVAPFVEEYRQVRDNTFLMERLETVSDDLRLLWEQGVPIQGVGGDLATMEERRRALLEFWGTRLPNPEGLAVSRVVEEFLRERVMRSEFPATDEELRWAESLRQDGRDLLLGTTEVYELRPEEREEVDAQREVE